MRLAKKFGENIAMEQKQHSSGQYYERLGGLESRMDTLEGSVRDLNSKVDRIITAVSGKRSFEPVQVLTFISLLAGIMAFSGAGIVYISNATQSGRIAVVEFQAKEMWGSGRWTPNLSIAAKRNDATAQ